MLLKVLDMALRKIKLGELIELSDKTNSDLLFSLDDVKGISIQKKFIETKADMLGVSLKPYLLVEPDSFAYVTVTSRNGEKITLAHNTTDKTYIVSSSYIVFKVKNKDILDSNYLFMFFNRPEFDRYSRFNSWGSAREVFSWDDMCDIDIELPDIDTQKKYASVYLSLIKNQKSYEEGLDDLKLTCDMLIDNVKKAGKTKLGSYITRRMEKNTNFSVTRLLGVGKDGFIEPKQDKDETNGHICYLAKKNDFVFAPPQLHEGSIDFYEGEETVKVSDAYIVFYITKPELLNPHYLKMVLKNPAIQHIIWFLRDGVREQFNFEQLSELEVPIPDIQMQNSVSTIFKVYQSRKEINQKLIDQIKDICPILIKGSIEEAKRS